MSVKVLRHDGELVERWDGKSLIYERAIGPAGELYIVAHNPQEADHNSERLLSGGRYVEVVYSPSGWVSAQGIKFDGNVNVLPAVAP